MLYSNEPEFAAAAIIKTNTHGTRDNFLHDTQLAWMNFADITNNLYSPLFDMARVIPRHQ